MAALACSPQGCGQCAPLPCHCCCCARITPSAARQAQSKRFKERVHSISWSPDGRWLASGASFGGDEDMRVLVWSGVSGELTAEFKVRRIRLFP